MPTDLVGHHPITGITAEADFVTSLGKNWARWSFFCNNETGENTCGALHLEDLHHLIAVIIDDFDGDPPCLWLGLDDAAAFDPAAFSAADVNEGLSELR